MSQISKGKVALQGSGLRRRYPVLPSSGQASTIPAGCDRPIQWPESPSTRTVRSSENLTIAAPVLVVMIRYQPGLAWSGS